jgi:hypothetical protein
MFRSSKWFILVLIVLIFATSAFAFAASITGLPATTRAGEGATVIGGYTVSNLDYVLTAGNPSTVSAVNFTLNAAATDVSVSLDGGTTFDTCSDLGSNNWGCTTTTSVASANQLVIVASDH